MGTPKDWCEMSVLWSETEAVLLKQWEMADK